MITLHFSEGQHVSFCDLGIVVSRNHSGQNSLWGGGGIQPSQGLIASLCRCSVTGPVSLKTAFMQSVDEHYHGLGLK